MGPLLEQLKALDEVAKSRPFLEHVFLKWSVA
jgi:hypothetical protein